MKYHGGPKYENVVFKNIKDVKTVCGDMSCNVVLLSLAEQYFVLIGRDLIIIIMAVCAERLERM